MEIVSILREWKRAFSNYRKYKKIGKLSALQGLILSNPNLSAITIEENRLLLNLKGGLRFEWDPYVPFSCLGLATNENYEVFELAIIKDLLSPEATVLDIGANFGYFSIAMKQFCPSIKLHSFEPIAKTFQLLNRNLKLNQIGDSFSYQLGLSDEDTTSTFYVPDRLGDAWASMGTGVAKELNHLLREEKCRVMTLDNFVTENKVAEVDFIKCDVEGAELLVIRGAKQTLLKDKPTLMLEIGDRWSSFFNYTRQDLIKLLITSFGYECFGIFNQSVVHIKMIDQVKQYPEDLLYNYFFIHPSKDKEVNILKQHIH